MADRYTEDELIAKLFKPIAGPLGFFLDDDAAHLPPWPGRHVVTTDALVAGVHFFADDPPALIAKKALRVNISDLYAKGAIPRYFTLTLCLPSNWTDDWLSAFAAGLQEDADAYQCMLIGGDTTATPGPLMVSITAIGSTDKDIYVSRSGAKPGDGVYVSGSIGDAALGLLLRRDGKLVEGLSSVARDYLLDRYLCPRPRVDLVQTVRFRATASMDISDGLAGDLAKLCRVSGVSAVIDLSSVPLSTAAREAIALEPALFETAMTGGDDYEILFTAKAAPGRANCVRIGAIVEGGGAPVFRDSDGFGRKFIRASFQHF